MAQPIARLYAEIGADTTKLKKGLDDTKKGLGEVAKSGEKTGASLISGFASVARGIGIASAAAGVFTGAMKGALELGKAGAELEYTREKFGRLAESIGTTAQALEKDLSSATRGMMSDAELLAAASDLMALGLVKTHDEALRLTKVSAGLGMNMNQLVLTLTNQTTMRFDALGVSVAGFDEKVQKLKDTGMSASAAFQEAFLQQAEAQLALVGEKADSAAGSFARLESAIKNMGDKLKRDALPILEDAAVAAETIMTWNEKVNAAYEEQMVKVENTTTSYEDYFEQMVLVGIAADKVHENTWKTTEAYEGNAEALGYVTEKLGIMTEAEWTQARAAEASAAYLRSLDTAYQGVAVAAEETVQPLSEVDSILRAEAGRAAAQSLKDLEGAFMDVKAATEDLQTAQENYREGVGNDIGRMLEDAKLEGWEYEAALAAIDEQQGTSLLSAHNLNKEMQELVAQYEKDKDVDKFREAVGKLSDSFEPLDERVAAARGEVDKLTQRLDLLDNRTIDVWITIHQNGEIPAIAGLQSWGQNTTVSGGGGNPGGNNNEMRALGGPVFHNKAYIVGEQGPELFVPSGNGYVLPNHQVNNSQPEQTAARPDSGGVVINGPITVIADHPDAFMRQLQALGRASRLASIAGAQYQGA